MITDFGISKVVSVFMKGWTRTKIVYGWGSAPHPAWESMLLPRLPSWLGMDRLHPSLLLVLQCWKRPLLATLVVLHIDASLWFV